MIHPGFKLTRTGGKLIRNFVKHDPQEPTILTYYNTYYQDYQKDLFSLLLKKLHPNLLNVTVQEKKDQDVSASY